MAIDFFGSETSKAPAVRCVGKSGQKIEMEFRLIQMMIPINSIATYNVKATNEKDFHKINMNHQVFSN